MTHPKYSPTRRLPPRRLLLLGAIFLMIVGFASPTNLAVPLDTVTDTTMRLETLPLGTAGMITEYVPESGMVYIIGGYRTNGAGTAKALSRNVWIYDPLLDYLRALPDLPYGIALAGSAYVPQAGKIYIFSGLDDSQGSNAVRSTVHAYDVNTGEFAVVIPHIDITTQGTRNSAVYVPAKNEIFVFFGLRDEAAVTPEAAYRTFDVATESYTGNSSMPAMPGGTNNHWGSAHLIDLPYPFIRDTEGADDTIPLTDQFIMVLGSEGYTLFRPEDRNFLLTTLSDELNHPRGAATALLPGQQEIWTSGGRHDGYDCHVWGSTLAIDPRLPIPPGEHNIRGFGYDPNNLFLTNGQNDGSAVYIPTLDRIISFGGFQYPADPCDVWQDVPAGGAYHDGFFSVGPEYDGGFGESGLVVTNIVNPIAGQPLNSLTITKSTPSSGVTEQFAIAIQAVFADEDGVARPGMETIFTGSIAYPSSASHNETYDSSDQIIIPSNIVPAPDNTNGQQVVGICLVSLFNSFQYLPNCREVAVTLDPGRLSGTVREDLTGVGQNGVIADLEGAIVELLDAGGDHLATTTTDANGNYDFCSDNDPSNDPDDDCLAVGTYTMNIRRPYVPVANPADRYLHIPQAVEVEVRAGELTNVNVNLETDPVQGPLIHKMSAQHNALYGDQVGTFLSFTHLDEGEDLPNIPVVNNTFTISVTRFVPTYIDPSAIFDVGSVEVTLNGNQATATSVGNNLWEVTFDMSRALSPGPNDLIITGYDQQTPPQKSERRYTVMAEAAKPHTNGTGTPPAGYVQILDVQWNAITEKYETTVRIPKNLRWPDDPPHVLDLELIKLYSQFRADVEIVEEFHINRQHAAAGDGAIQVQILSTDPDNFDIDEQFEVTPIMNAAGTDIEAYQIESDSYDLCALGLPKCGEWIPIKYFERAVSYEVGPAEFSAEFALGITAQYAGTIRLDGTLRGDNYTLKKVRIIPQPELALQAKGEASVSASIDLFFSEPSITIGGGVEVTGRLYYAQPIVYEPARSIPVYLDNPCVRFLATAYAWASLPSPFPDLDTGEIELVDVQEGDACSSERGFRIRSLPAPPDLPVPVVAMSSDRRHSLQVWVEDGMSRGIEVSQLHYTLVTDGSASNGTIPGTTAVTDPAVTFTGDTSVMVVWSQFDPDTAVPGVATMREIMATQEIYAAVWTEGGGWETPVRLTNNSVSDGLPVAAADLNTGQVLVAWMRDNDADPETKTDLRIITRHWNGATWTGEQTVSNDNTSADTQPAIAYTGDGSEAWIVWTREHDANFNTNADRRLNYAIWNGSSWGSAVEPTAWPAGALNPALVFSNESDKPLVTMIVRGDLGQDDAGNELGEAALGKEGRLYAAWYGSSATEWDVQSVHDTRAEFAQPILASPNRALIVMRNFGGGGSDSYPSAGRIAVSAGEINAGGARWIEPGLITTNNLPLWQVEGFSVPLGSPADADFGLNFVGVQQDPDLGAGRAAKLVSGAPAAIGTANHVYATNIAGTNGTSILGFGATTDGVDIALEDVIFSTLSPAPGEVVTITGTVRSQTMRPMSWAGGTGVIIDLKGYRDGVNENLQLDRAEYYGDMLFNERYTFTLSYRSTGEAGTIYLKARYLGGDLNTGDNEFYQRVGILDAPRDLMVDELPGKTMLSWLPPESAADLNWFFRVYRGPSAEGPWRFTGVTRYQSFIDDSPDDTLPFYAIEAYDQYSNKSVKLSGSSSTASDVPAADSGNEVSFTSSEVLVQETDGTALLTVGLLSPAESNVTVNYATSNGTAIAGADYTNTSGSLLFTSGEQTKEILIPINDDGNNEENETLSVTLSNPSGAILGTKSSSTVTILDDDDGTADSPSVSLSVADTAVYEGIGEVMVQVSLSKAWSLPVTVKLVTSPGTAVVSSDYGDVNQTLTFEPNETSKMVPIPIVDDVFFEPDETFTIRLMDANNASLSDNYSLTITILNEDEDTGTAPSDKTVYLPLVIR